MVGMGALIYAFLWWWYRRENARRESGEAAAAEKFRGMSDDELRELGDDSPHYRYTI